MTTQIDKFQNINEFRTQIMSTYRTFPIAAADNIFFIKKKASKDAVQPVTAEKRDDNILLEKAYLNTSWHVIRC